jgi:HK97 family phage major capsid protein
MINVQQLTTVMAEANALTSKPQLSKREERRLSFLMSAASAIKSGADLREIEIENHQAEERAAGLPVTQFAKGSLTTEQRARALAYQAFFKHAPQSQAEFRDMVEGAPMLSHIGTYSGLGYFVPTGFGDLYTTLKAHDALFDPDVVTLVRTTHGRVISMPLADDTGEVATVVGEAGSQSSVDLGATGEVALPVFSYSTPRFVLSLEAADDLEASFTASALFGRFSADRLARGIGQDLVNGDGSTEAQGLVTALIGLGVTPVTCSGSASNTGGAETGANSIGTADYANAYQALDQAYLNSDKCRWFMNLKTLGKLLAMTDKYGSPIGQPFLTFNDGVPSILGIPVAICPSMQDIGASANPVVLGDGSYFGVRLTTEADGLSGMRIYTQAPNLVEQGKFGLRTFVRAGSALLYSGSGPCPFVLMQNHS